DGFDNNDNGIAGQAFQPNNIEAVHEVTVLTNSYAAEFGRGGGSVSNLTFKNGTNAFHGSAWEQYNGSFLDALGPEQAASGNTRVPQYVNNVFGFDFGGPVKKDKLFFYGTAQWNRNYGASTSAAQLFLPSQAGVATLQSLGPNSNVDLLLSAIGDLRGSTALGSTTVDIGGRPGCAAPCPVEFGTLTRSDSGAGLGREWTTRMDYNAGPNDNIFVRYTDSQSSLSPDLFANPGALPSQDTFQGGPSRLLGTMWAHTFSPTVLNELRFSAQQIDFTFSPLASTAANPNAHLPSIFFQDSTNIFVGGFEQGTFPQGRGHKTFQFQDAVSISKGSHTLKIGADLALLLIRDQIPFNTDGGFTVTGGGDCDGGGGTTIVCSDLANFIDGFAGTGTNLSKSFGNPRINTPAAQQAYYIQDTWKMRSNLTLDLGLRYEYQTSDYNNILAYPAVDRNALDIGNFFTRYEQKPDRNNFGPRVGFAYSPHFWNGLFGNGGTVIRGGYGLFYDAFYTNISNNTASTAPNTLGGTIDPSGPRGTADPIAAINAITAVASTTDLRFSVDDHLVNPLTHQWNLNVQRELPLKLLFEVAYVGTRGERLFASEQLNPRTPVLEDNGPRIHDGLGSVVVRGNRGDSIYHGLQSSVSRSVGRLQLRGSYTWSRAIDNSSEIFATSGLASRWENVADPRSDRGPSAFHRTHRASITWAYDLPSPKNSVLNAILGGWTSSGFVSFQSGAPETVFLGGWDQNGDGETVNDRPSWGNRSARIDYSTACLASTTACSGVGFDDGSGNLVDWNTGAPGTISDFRYIINDYGSGVQGNVGRNSIYYPGRQDWNLSVLKSFNLPMEGHKLQFRADFFNAFNHPNDGVDSLSGSYGNINSSRFMDVPLTRRGARHIALWAKYSF
ncbi:MAG TPA: TonB-dependent receptor, partial [Terriglobales bacterium]